MKPFAYWTPRLLAAFFVPVLGVLNHMGFMGIDLGISWMFIMPFVFAIWIFFTRPQGSSRWSHIIFVAVSCVLLFLNVYIDFSAQAADRWALGIVYAAVLSVGLPVCYLCFMVLLSVEYRITRNTFLIIPGIVAALLLCYIVFLLISYTAGMAAT